MRTQLTHVRPGDELTAHIALALVPENMAEQTFHFYHSETLLFRQKPYLFVCGCLETHPRTVESLIKMLQVPASPDHDRSSRMASFKFPITAVHMVFLIRTTPWAPSLAEVLRWLCATTILAHFNLGSASAAQATCYNFSPVNQYNVQVSASFWNPIISYVASRSGVCLNLKLGRTSADTTSFILAREVDFAFTNHLFSPERAKMGWTVFGRRNLPPVRSQIVVPADSPIRNLKQLAGATVGFPGPEALVAYKVSYAQLLQRNIPINVVFAGNQDAAFTQLFAGMVTAVGANSQLVENWKGREGAAFRVLWSSEPYNDLALMYSPRVPASKAAAVARAFLDMHRDHEGKRILDAAGELVHSRAPISFVAANDGDYTSYRTFYAGAPAAVR